MTTGGFSSKRLARVRDLLARHVDAGYSRKQSPSSPATARSSANVRIFEVPPELADRVGALEVGEHEDVEQFGAGAGRARLDVPLAGARADPASLLKATPTEDPLPNVDTSGWPWRILPASTGRP